MHIKVILHVTSQNAIPPLDLITNLGPRLKNGTFVIVFFLLLFYSAFCFPRHQHSVIVILIYNNIEKTRYKNHNVFQNNTIVCNKVIIFLPPACVKHVRQFKVKVKSTQGLSLRRLISCVV